MRCDLTWGQFVCLKATPLLRLRELLPFHHLHPSSKSRSAESRAEGGGGVEELYRGGRGGEGGAVVVQVGK